MIDEKRFIDLLLLEIERVWYLQEKTKDKDELKLYQVHNECLFRVIDFVKYFDEKEKEWKEGTIKIKELRKKELSNV